MLLQHYVVNSSINEQLASVARVEDGDCVLEIGPGTGALTQVLLDAGATVLAVEKVRLPTIHALSYFSVLCSYAVHYWMICVGSSYGDSCKRPI